MGPAAGGSWGVVIPATEKTAPLWDFQKISSNLIKSQKIHRNLINPQKSQWLVSDDFWWVSADEFRKHYCFSIKPWFMQNRPLMRFDEICWSRFDEIFSVSDEILMRFDEIWLMSFWWISRNIIALASKHDFRPIGPLMRFWWDLMRFDEIWWDLVDEFLMNFEKHYCFSIKTWF